jgi:hypothetical protein
MRRGETENPKVQTSLCLCESKPDLLVRNQEMETQSWEPEQKEYARKERQAALRAAWALLTRTQTINQE